MSSLCIETLSIRVNGTSDELQEKVQIEQRKNRLPARQRPPRLSAVPMRVKTRRNMSFLVSPIPEEKSSHGVPPRVIKDEMFETVQLPELISSVSQQDDETSPVHTCNNDETEEVTEEDEVAFDRIKAECANGMRRSFGSLEDDLFHLRQSQKSVHSSLAAARNDTKHIEDLIDNNMRRLKISTTILTRSIGLAKETKQRNFQKGTVEFVKWQALRRNTISDFNLKRQYTEGLAMEYKDELKKEEIKQQLQALNAKAESEHHDHLPPTNHRHPVEDIFTRRHTLMGLP